MTTVANTFATSTLTSSLASMTEGSALLSSSLSPSQSEELWSASVSSMSASISSMSASITSMSHALATASLPSASAYAASSSLAFEASILSAQSQNLVDLTSNYGMVPSLGGNMAFAILFGIICVAHICMAIWYKQRWIGVAFFFGLLLEIIGYAARAKAHTDYAADSPFLAQIICLTIAPCFIMGGYYYLLGQLVMAYEARYSVLKPIFYSYIFIFCDIVSLVLQAAGGGLAAGSLTGDSSTKTGTHIMIAGLSFQVFTMSMFLFFWFTFFYKVYFGSDKEVSSVPKKTLTNFTNLAYKDHLFDPRYAHIRSRTVFKVFPFAVLFGTICIYTRCIYRVIELAQGWNGFLITHENYVFVLDGMMILLAVYVLIPPFYPGFAFGRENKVEVPKAIKSKKDRGYEGGSQGDTTKDEVSN